MSKVQINLIDSQIKCFREHSSESSSETAVEISDSSENGQQSKRKKKKKKKAKDTTSGDSSTQNSSEESDEDTRSNDTYDLLRTLWPRDKRPVGLKTRAEVNGHSVETLLSKYSNFFIIIFIICYKLQNISKFFYHSSQ